MNIRQQLDEIEGALLEFHREHREILPSTLYLFRDKIIAERFLGVLSRIKPHKITDTMRRGLCNYIDGDGNVCIWCNYLDGGVFSRIRYRSGLQTEIEPSPSF